MSPRERRSPSFFIGAGLLFIGVYLNKYAKGGVFISPRIDGKALREVGSFFDRVPAELITECRKKFPGIARLFRRINAEFERIGNDWGRDL
jgi:hypothetical protein